MLIARLETIAESLNGRCFDIESSSRVRETFSFLAPHDEPTLSIIPRRICARTRAEVLSDSFFLVCLDIVRFKWRAPAQTAKRRSDRQVRCCK